MICIHVYGVYIMKAKGSRLKQVLKKLKIYMRNAWVNTMQDHAQEHCLLQRFANFTISWQVETGYTVI